MRGTGLDQYRALDQYRTGRCVIAGGWDHDKVCPPYPPTHFLRYLSTAHAPPPVLLRTLYPTSGNVIGYAATPVLCTVQY
eukprot:121054-Rhodomonas_salina.2